MRIQGILILFISLACLQTAVARDKISFSNKLTNLPARQTGNYHQWLAYKEYTRLFERLHSSSTGEFDSQQIERWKEADQWQQSGLADTSKIISLQSKTFKKIKSADAVELHLQSVATTDTGC